jgi:hypothetical protein
MITSRSLRAATLLALLGSAPVFGAAYVGSAYDGFDYTAGNIAQPATVSPTGMTGGSGWTDMVSGGAAPTIWGVTHGGNYTTITTSGNGRFAVAGNTGTAASANQQIIGTSLSYSGLPGLAPSTGGSVQLTAASSASVGRHFGQLVDSGTFYFSYLVQKTSNTSRTTNLAFFGTAATNPLTTAPVERLSIGQVAPNLNYMNAAGTLNNATSIPPANSGDFQVLNSNSLASTSSIYKSSGIFERNLTTNPNSIAALPMTQNETFMVVGKIQFNVGVNSTDDALTLWINPTSFTETSDSAYLMVTGVDFGTLTGLRIFGGATSGIYTQANAVYDEVRLGTAFSDVVVAAVPEPSAFAALAGLAGLAFAASRRRRA